MGKAKSLRDRARSYFAKGAKERPQVDFLLNRAKDIEFIVTDTEKEALLLENTLIKRHRPRYNVSLRDDKSYISIRIGRDHPWPGINLTRRLKDDGALYFGPYDQATAAREAVEQITRYFRLRSCTDREFANRVRPCLEYDIGRCTAPCVGRVSPKDYSEQVEEATMFLSGKRRELIRHLEVRMQEASQQMRFEEAGRMRDVVRMLRSVLERQEVVRRGGKDHDAIGVAVSGLAMAICVLQVRQGALVGRIVHHIPHACGEIPGLVEEFLLQLYRSGSDTPPRIVLSHRPESQLALEEVVGDRRGAKVKIHIPSRGSMKRLVDLATTNAREALLQREARRDDLGVLDRMGKRLGLALAPQFVECLDISDLGGREAVGALVAFRDGQPDRTLYRHYNIRTLETPDDYMMMREVLMRRFEVTFGKRKVARRRRPLPDLLLIDGGKGHLAAACRAMKDVGVRIPVAAIAKGTAGQADRVFVPGRKNPLSLKRGSDELLLLMRIRDEAHRFGLAAHRRRRGKKSLASALKGVRGLGSKRIRLLLEKFGGLEGIRQASIEELSSLPGISSILASQIKRHLR